MSRLLWRSSLRFLRRHPLQTGLAVGGVALGVAVVVAVDLATASAGRAFEISTETLQGSTTHQVLGGPGGLPEEVYPRLVLEARVEPAAPVVEEAVRVVPEGAENETGRQLRLLGIDPLTEAPFRASLGGLGGQLDLDGFLTRPGRVALSRETARELGLELGDGFRILAAGSLRRVELAGLLDPPAGPGAQAFGELLVADLSTAQELLGRPGVLTRVDLAVPEGEEGQAMLERARGVLPAEARIFDAGSRASATAGMTDAFELNLRSLSLLALLCGTFLVFNTARFSVVQRWRLFGRLRALGVTGRQLLGLSLAEALVVGIVGGLLGLALGIGLGHGLVRLVTRTINDLYFAVEVRRLFLDGGVLARGLGMGLGASLLGAWLPAREAATASPRRTLSRAVQEVASRGRLRTAVAVGALLMAGGGLLLYWTPELGWSFMGILALVLGFALWTPAATVAAMKVLERPARGLLGFVGAMAARGVTASLSRTGVAIAALTLAVSVTVGVGVMIDSFRGSVERWLETTLEADLYVSPPRLRTGRHLAPLSPELAESIRSLPGVEVLNTVRRTEIETAEGPVLVAAVDLDAAGRASYTQLSRAPGAGDGEGAWSLLAEGRAVMVSEPYAFRHGAEAGDEVELPTDAGPRSFQVAAVYRDYGSERGVVLFDRATYDRHWRDSGFDAFSLRLAPGADRDAVMAAVRRLGEGTDLTVRSNRELRRFSLEIFDRTFLITNVLRLLAGGVAFLGVLGALVALQLERRRELAVLRANGLTRKQLRRLVTAQTGLMGLVAGLLSVPLGLVLSLVMIYVINRRSFGWTLDLQVDPAILLKAVLLAVLAALLAGVLPAKRMAESPITEGLREE